MCGIAGFSGSFDLDLLRAMTEKVAHRGPDDQDVLLLETPTSRVGLGHRRLSIIDLSASGHEPMGVTCGHCGFESKANVNRGRWLIYNGEIYNYRELRAELEAAGHHFFSKSDTEVLLHLYNDAGIEMLPRLNGMFAFALYDGRGNERAGVAPGSLVIARDGFGVKPLYYAQTPRGLVFGSEMKSLLLADDVARDLDYVALHEYLAYLWATAPRTPFKAVRKLPPGNAMVVRDGRIERQWVFYDWPYGQEPPLEESEDAIAERLRDTFATAVKRQLVADVQVGSFLSGGLDSSSIVAMMRRSLGDAVIPCYTIANVGGSTADAGSPDDLPYAKRVAEQYGVELRIVDISPAMIRELPTMLYHLDEPQGDPAPINSMLIARRAHADGVKVLMSGTGGDDMFTGYRRHTSLHFEPYWAWLPAAARRPLARLARSVASGNGVPAAMHHPAGRRIAKVFSHADLDADRRIAAYFFWSTENVRRPLYAPEFARAVAGHETASSLLESLGRIPNEHDRVNRMLYVEAKHFLADHNLNYADKTTMSASVESRVPFLDPDLARLATRIPSRLKQKGTIGKAILKKAMEPFLPRDVIYRPKTGFGAPIRHWLRDELRPTVEELLAPDSLRRRGLFDPAAVRRLVDLDRAGRVDGGHTIFALLCIELWCRTFVDQKVPAPVRF